MGIRDWFSRKTRLQQALERGMQPGSELWDNLEPLDDYSVKSAEDAEAICAALRLIVTGHSELGGDSALDDLAGLFYKVPDATSDAFQTLREQGIPLLIEAINAAIAGGSRREPSTSGKLLCILAMYATPGGDRGRGARGPHAGFA